MVRREMQRSRRSPVKRGVAAAMALASVGVVVGSSNGCSGSTTSNATTPITVPTGGACNVTLEQATITSAVHVPQGTAVTYATNPACGGDHYPVWTTWGVHTAPVADGNWVHNLEHGGVALLYRCDGAGACTEFASQLAQIANAQAQEAACAGTGVTARVLVAPEPTLPADAPIGIAAWGYVMHATCVDANAIQKFIDAHIGRGPEAICADGQAMP
jgi:hypothetical protein